MGCTPISSKSNRIRTDETRARYSTGIACSSGTKNKVHLLWRYLCSFGCLHYGLEPSKSSVCIWLISTVWYVGRWARPPLSTLQNGHQHVPGRCETAQGSRGATGNGQLNVGWKLSSITDSRTIVNLPELFAVHRFLNAAATTARATKDLPTDRDNGRLSACIHVGMKLEDVCSKC